MRRPIDYQRVAVLYERGLKDAAIAAEVGCAATTILGWRKRHGFPCHPTVPPYDAAARRLYDQGAYDSEIARRCGISMTAVRKWRGRHGLRKNSDGRSCQGPKIDGAAVRALFDEGLSDAAIAARLGFQASTVRRARQRMGLRRVGGSRRRFDRAEAAALLRAGRLLDEVAQALGVSDAAILGAARHDADLSAALAETRAARKAIAQRRAAVARRWGGAADAAPDPEARVPLRAAPPVKSARPIAAAPISGAPRPPGFCADRDARLVASGGRYRDLAALADRWGMDLRRVQARFHVVAGLAH